MYQLLLLLLIATLHLTSSQPQLQPVNEDNLRRFMSLKPDELEKFLKLLENPYIAAALVHSNGAIGETGDQQLQPPKVDVKQIENDPYLASFFQRGNSDAVSFDRFSG